MAVAPRREVSINVTAKHITKSISKLLISRHCAVRALALAIGIGIKNESALEYFIHNSMQCMVNDSVSKRRRGNGSMLGVKYFCSPVAPRPVGFASKFALKCQYFMFQIDEKFRHVALQAFSLWLPDSMHQEVPKTKRYRRKDYSLS